MPSRSPEAIVIEDVRIPAGDASLYGKLGYPEQEQPIGAAVLAGPHPLLGGSMDNNLMRALGDGLAERGVVTLRFDYRDSTEGDGPRLARQMTEFWQKSSCADETLYGRDLEAAVAFLAGVIPGTSCPSEPRTQRSGVSGGLAAYSARRLASGAAPTDSLSTPLALIGYSFGCSLLPQVVTAHRVSALILVAPTLGRHDLDGFLTLTQPKLVIAPHGDFALDETRLPAWFDRLTGPKELVRPTIDGHFFRGCEADVVATVAAFLDRQWRPRA